MKPRVHKLLLLQMTEATDGPITNRISKVSIKNEDISDTDSAISGSVEL